MQKNKQTLMIERRSLVIDNSLNIVEVVKERRKEKNN